MSLKKVFIDAGRCDGCGECEKACAARFGGKPYRAPDESGSSVPKSAPLHGALHGSARGFLPAHRLVKHIPRSRIRVESFPRVFIPLLCFHCEDAPCVEACISGAMATDPSTGLVLIDEKRCVGCWSCVMTCPFGVVKPDFKREKSTKCDGCAGRKTPACVKSCRPQALLYLNTVAFPDRKARARLAVHHEAWMHKQRSSKSQAPNPK